MAIDTDLKICALAMSWLGSDAPTDLETPVSTPDIVCAANYEASRDAVLEDGEFSFAIGRDKLDSPTEVEGEPNKFDLGDASATILRLLQVGAKYDFTDNTQWVKEGNFVRVELDEVYIRYIAQITDVTLMTPSVIQAIAAHIAAVTAVTMTNSAKVEERRWAIYGTKLATAMANDGRVGKSRQLTSDALINARYSAGGSGYMGPYV